MSAVFTTVWILNFLSQCSRPYCGFLCRRVFTCHAWRLCLSRSHSSLSFSESTVQCHPWGSTPQNRQRILGQEGSTVIHLAASRPAWTQRGERHEKQDESADHMTKNTKGTMLASLSQISVVRNRQDRFCFMDSQCHWIYWKYMTIINIDMQL